MNRLRGLRAPSSQRFPRPPQFVSSLPVPRYGARQLPLPGLFAVQLPLQLPPHRPEMSVWDRRLKFQFCAGLGGMF